MGKLQTILQKFGISGILPKPNNELINPETYKWDKDEENEELYESYYLEIFKENERNMAKHQLALFYNPQNKETLKPLTEKEKDAMFSGDAQGPLR